MRKGEGDEELVDGDGGAGRASTTKEKEASEEERKAVVAQRKKLVDALCDVVSHLDWMENHIEHGSEGEPFYQRVNAYIDSLYIAEGLRESLRGLPLPSEALTRMDDPDVNANPEDFSRIILERCDEEYSRLQTRLAGISKLRQEMKGWEGEDDTCNSRKN